MVDSYNIQSQTVDANGLLTFPINSILTGCTVSHAAGSTTFSLNKPGLYFVAFNAVGTISGATAGVITVQLQNNGIAVPGALSSDTSASTTDVRNISFTKVIRVNPSCCAVNNQANLTFVNTGLGAIYTNANVVITKLA